MKRLKSLIILFCLALAVPLGYFVFRTQHGLAREEVEELRFFSETLFDRMEEDLEELVRREESRAMDEYGYYLSRESQGGPKDRAAESVRSPLSEVPRADYILGYLQNGPDGSFQTPLVDNQAVPPAPIKALVDKLRELNTVFNQKRQHLPVHQEEPAQKGELAVKKQSKKEYGIGSRYLSAERLGKQKSSLGREEKRIEEITVAQARNLSQQQVLPPQQLNEAEALSTPAPSAPSAPSALDPSTTGKADIEASEEATLADTFSPAREDNKKLDWNRPGPESRGSRRQATVADDAAEPPAPALSEGSAHTLQNMPTVFQVEVDPFQSLVIDERHVFIFRRIVLDNQIYRQGLVIKVDAFLRYLGDTYFSGQPLAGFANLQLAAAGPGQSVTELSLGAPADKPEFELQRVFPRPFSFLTAELFCDNIPRSTGRRTLGLMMGVLITVVLLGMYAIYRSAGLVMELSERRAGFVSSVTHELKTPLTNIRMYIEMLEQGIARDKEREADYFRILRSESERLTRLINNVLEFSKLEKRQRRLTLTRGNLDEVISEAGDVMGEKLRREGFVFVVEKKEIPLVSYDREAMIQILINLIDNSIKFGRNSPVKEIKLRVEPVGDQVEIRLCDTGPGLPGQAVKKVFNDFYRVDNSLTRSTKGTGIGLALVKKFVRAMNGRVWAENNDGPGCRIIVRLPVAR